MVKGFCLLVLLDCSPEDDVRCHSTLLIKLLIVLTFPYTPLRCRYRTAQHNLYRPVTVRICLALGFCREGDENCALLGYYAVSGGNFLQTFRDNLSALSSGFKNLKNPAPMKMDR